MLLLEHLCWKTSSCKVVQLGKINVGHSYKMGSSVWGCSYTEKDLAAVVAACLGMWASGTAVGE